MSAFFLSCAEDEKELRTIESQFCLAIRDAVNRPDRKPFYWGGLKGYQQLESIAKTLQVLAASGNTYFIDLKQQVDRVLAYNQRLAKRLAQAHGWLLRIAACLRYPPRSYETAPAPTRPQVQQEMQALLHDFAAEADGDVILQALYGGLYKRWNTYGDDLLHCFEIVGLPPDNLKIEGLFGWLRRQQRRISGRKSTQPLGDFGHSQICFRAKSQEQLLAQLRQVSLLDYKKQRQYQAQVEATRQFRYRLHRNPDKTVQQLAAKYTALQVNSNKQSAPISSDTN